MERIAVSDTGSDLQTVVRAGAILYAFTPETPELGLTQLAVQLELSKATVHRLAQTLVSLGLLEQNAVTRGYRLGVSLLRLAHVVESSLDIRREARAALRELRDATGETVYLMLLRDGEAVCAERIEGSHPMRDLSTPPGTRVPLGVGAAGSAILAVLDGQTEQDALAAITDAARRDEVAARIVAARAQGYAFSRGDVAQGVGAIAVALCDDEGTPVGALSLGGLLERVEQSESDLSAAVRRAADTVAVSMGWKNA